MEPWLVFAVLLLPMPWRVLVGCAFPWSRWPRVGVALFLVPLLALGFALSVTGALEGETFVGLPILIAGFWLPQFILIAFFACCEREHAAYERKPEPPDAMDSR
jgi:hypothetical protein